MACCGNIYNARIQFRNGAQHAQCTAAPAIVIIGLCVVAQLRWSAGASSGSGSGSAAAAVRFFLNFTSARAAAGFTHFMSKVKLGSRVFDVDSEEIVANWCGVSDADCIALAARMKTGEISRVKILDLVRLFFQFCLCFVLFQCLPFLRFSAASFHRAAITSASPAPEPSLMRCL